MADNKEASSAAEDDPMLQEFTQKCQEVMEEKRRTMERELDESFNSRMSELQNRYQSQKQDSIATWQTDILRMNKIFRDIARQLGADWRPVFDTLMGHLELTEAEMDFERKKIEKQKPFMQAYKALLTWKEKNGEQFDMLQLVEALKKSNQYDLAEKTLDIMDSQGDSLMALDQVGKGIASGATRGAASESDETNGTEGAESAKTPTKKPAAVPKAATGADGGLDDRNMLQLAKKVGDDWVCVGETLGLSQETLDEIIASEGHGYQGGFKMLWNWRDTLNEMEEDENLQTLKRALEKVGKKDSYVAVFGSK